MVVHESPLAPHSSKPECVCRSVATADAFSLDGMIELVSVRPVKEGIDAIERPVLIPTIGGLASPAVQC
jgi:hypothetical protein